MKVSVVILNFKVKLFTLSCIESVKKSTFKNLEIIVLDNGSADGLEEEMEKYTSVIFFQNGSNLGYSGGNNVGIKKALEGGADYIFILNPDTIIEEKCIERLVNGMEETGAGIVGPKIYFEDKKTIWYAGGIFDRDNVIGKHRGVNQKDNNQYNQAVETDYVTGAAMMIKREVFERIGFFDEKYFLYYEDADFCERAKRAGFKVMYIPGGIVYHENAKSTVLGSSLQDYYISRNRMLYARKFLPFRTQFALFREAIKNLGNPMRRLALLDFITGNLGKGSLS